MPKTKITLKKKKTFPKASQKKPKLKVKQKITDKKKKVKTPIQKKIKKKPLAKKPAKKELEKKARYWEGVGRRKTAVARVRIFKDTKEKDTKEKISVNEREYCSYFPLLELSQVAVSPLKKLDLWGRFSVSVKVRGGGISSQAEAVRHGLSRALIKFNEENRQKLRHLGYLTRDPRMRERKKFGLKRARRAPQWSKR